jgi:L-ascorbate metabolism protein UlaG (beta-lactamase superfamily)
VPDLQLIRDRSSGAHLTWIGHASFLGCLGGSHFLIDPVFAQRIAVVYRRFGKPGLRADQLPELSAVMISHNHYDHLDMDSLRAIPARVPVVCPLGLASRLRRRSRHRCLELNWWESTTLDGLKITLVPARHWSRRGIVDTNRSLWGGFVVEADDKRLYHAGDTAWFGGFAEIGQRFPRLVRCSLRTSRCRSP